MKTSKLPLLKRSSILVVGLLVIYSLERLVFYINNIKVFGKFSSDEIIQSFGLGLRFDLAALVISNTPFFLFFMLPINWQKNRRLNAVVVGFFVLINFCFISLNLMDVELYQLTGKRSTLELLRLSGDILQQAGQIIFFYWYLSLLALALAYVLYRLFPSVIHRQKKFGGLVSIFEASVMLILLVLAARGGWQLKPLKVAHAFVFSGDDLGTLTLNTPFTMLRSRESQLKPMKENLSEPELNQVLPVNVNWSSSPTGENVVLIILESFAMEFVGAGNQGKGYTPFLDELAHRGIFFTHAFANGRRSIEAIPSLLSGIPSLLPDPFIISNFASNRIEGLGNVLKQMGYSTAFFHGAENGTMYFDSFSKRAGFDKYFGLNEYPDKGDSDGNWGIYDEPYLQYAIKEMGNMSPPFASVIFTLSSHQPYSVPEKYQGRFPKGTLEIHQSIGYTDYSLRQFFKSAEKEPWFKNTLFVLTADHTTKSDNPAFSNILGHFRVPLVFYRPGRNFPPVNADQLVQHVDVPLSIMQLIGVQPRSWTRMGRSVFAETKPWVFNRSENGYWYLDKEVLIKWSQNQPTEYFSVSDSSIEAMDNHLLSQKRLEWSGWVPGVLQYFINGMWNNRLLVDRLPKDRAN